jgi:hypothetical protein
MSGKVYLGLTVPCCRKEWPTQQAVLIWAFLYEGGRQPARGTGLRNASILLELDHLSWNDFICCPDAVSISTLP